MSAKLAYGYITPCPLCKCTWALRDWSIKWVETHCPNGTTCDLGAPDRRREDSPDAWGVQEGVDTLYTLMKLGLAARAFESALQASS